MTATPSVHRRTTCRLCGSQRLEPVISLAPTPPANAYVVPADVRYTEPSFPLDVYLCEGCTHLQLLDIVDARSLFEKYVYVSGQSGNLAEHFARYARDVAMTCRLTPGDLVVDIGSNDGTLLSFFKEQGMQVIGIDPAEELASTASNNGIPTWPEFFTSATANRILERFGPAKLITANNVLAHIDDLGSTLDDIEACMAPNGTLVFEVSYLADVYQKTLFDTIYHEHLDYHSVASLLPFFQRHGMELFAAARVETHGGSLRGFVQRRNGSAPTDGSIERLIELERSLKLHEKATWLDFAERITELGRQLRHEVERCKADSKSIAGYGAPAKATTLLHHFQIAPETLEFVVDDNPLKQGLLTPGLHIPIVSHSELERSPIDYLLILAWNFADWIIQKEDSFRAEGGRFIIPLPKVVVV